MSLRARVVDVVVDRAILPDAVLRRVVRLLLRRRLARELRGGAEAVGRRKRALVAELAASPVAPHADEANAQHYEVPTEFFELMLGPRLKYSSAYWPAGVVTLAGAEEAMLRLTCERAGLRDGQDVLDLGCGWGSLTLWIAGHCPASRITAVSNSATQRDHIEKQAAARGLDNVTVLTRDVARLELPPGSFDRVVSVEMFEHVRNHSELLARIASWLRPDGALFVHVFAHRELAYPFAATGGGGDWMARRFFTGGLMPSDDLLLHFADDVAVEDHWVVDGRHYARTLEAWLQRIDADRGRAVALLDDAYGPGQGRRWLHRWRVFTIACAELFAHGGGREWRVSHYRFRPRRPADVGAPL